MRIAVGRLAPPEISQARSVTTSTPFSAFNTMKVKSATGTPLYISSMNSSPPGVSSNVTAMSLILNVPTAMSIVHPRSFSSCEASKAISLTPALVIKAAASVVLPLPECPTKQMFLACPMLMSPLGRF